jgi:hypothetical protein
MEKRHFFISRSGKDAEDARRVCSALGRHGYSYHEQEQWPPGTNFIMNMSAAIDASEYTLAFFSEAYFAHDSGFTNTEWTSVMALARERLIGIRIEEVKVPSILSSKTYIDLVGRGHDDAMELMLSKVAKLVIDLPLSVGEWKPPSAPSRPWQRRLRVPMQWIGAAVALLLAVVFALSFVQVRALGRAKSDENARVAFERLRTLQAGLVPRLWLVGPWKPERLAEGYFTRRADAIDAVATPLLRSRIREEADRGLVLATLAAFKRGGVPSKAARDYAQRQNYARLDGTLRGNEPRPGTALAAWRGPRGFLIAEESRVWSCPANDVARCVQTELPDLDAVTGAAFVSETRLDTVSIDGSVNQWDLGTFTNPVASAIREGDPQASVASDGGDTAIVFTAAPHVIVILADRRRIPTPGNMRPVRRATFGPCDPCVTLLFDNESVVVWNYDSAKQWTLTDGAQDAAATRKGFVAVAMRDGAVRFYDANGNGVATVHLDSQSIKQLTISPYGHRAAVVHDDGLSVVDDDGTILQLIPAARRPAPVAAAWASDVLVTRTPSEVRLWNLAPSSVPDVAPGDAWRERRKQLGMTVDTRGNVVAGNGGPRQLGWNGERGRIESQD